MDKRWIAVAVGVVALVGIFLAVRPRDDADVPKAPTSTETPSPSGHEDGEMTMEPSATMPAEDEVPVVVGVRAGKVTGPGTATVKVGDRLHLTVTSDVVDEVHVHGYDLTADVGPDEPAHVELVAATAGIFEVELEGSGLLLVRIRVEP